MSVIRRTGYSTCFPCGKIFLKIISPYARTSAENEFAANRLVCTSEVATYKFLFSFVLWHRRIIVMKNYTSCAFPINDSYMVGCKNFNQIDNCITTIQTIHGSSEYFWQEFMRPEMENALDNLEKINIDPVGYKTILNALIPNVTIHGDFSADNLSLINGQLFVFDWQLMCKGPEDWDKSYYIASSTKKDFIDKRILKHINKSLHPLILLCCAVRLGRAIRKGKEYEDRLELLKRWENALDI